MAVQGPLVLIKILAYIGFQIPICWESKEKAIVSRGRQLKKVLQLKTFFQQILVKCNWSTKHFLFDLNLEQHTGLKVRGSEINFII